MSNKNKMLIVDKKELKRFMSEKKAVAARNEKKVEALFAKYLFLWLGSALKPGRVSLFVEPRSLIMIHDPYHINHP